jgi:hypothetical protein
MVRVSIEVRSGATCFRVRVQASSIERAASLMQRLHSASNVRVLFPIDPEGFCVEDVLAEEGPIERGKPQGDLEELAA